MPKYVLAYHGGSTPTTQAEQEAVMAAWLAWFSRTADDAVVDGGNPTGASRHCRARTVQPVRAAAPTP